LARKNTNPATPNRLRIARIVTLLPDKRQV
jgi:hypothetical protein